MGDKARQRMIDGINKMSGRANCSEAVSLQQRSLAAMLVLGVAFVAVMTMVSLTIELGAIVAGGIAGLVVGGAMTFLTTTFWLGYCDGELFLVKANRWQTKPVELVAQYTYPVQSSVTSGLFVKKVTVAGTDYLLPRQFEERLRLVTGT